MGEVFSSHVVTACERNSHAATYKFVANILAYFLKTSKVPGTVAQPKSNQKRFSSDVSLFVDTTSPTNFRRTRHDLQP